MGNNVKYNEKRTVEKLSKITKLPLQLKFLFFLGIYMYILNWFVTL